ncbi:Beta-glucan synthesis-associated protein SKN1 [Phytophthora cinnamomi]|uniref:Beta-glucan synthesis-associated protein SKN1 n=1 Tax=Phytophthora cinnamomi TaxID=4785 RepID=UPI0035594DC3|nr:Beta-glucan synthesis-associated protein SKN1 [Phytophthora cinnamomi]
MLQQLALAAAFLQASIISQAAAHGNIYDPKPEGTGGDYTYYFGGPAGSIDMPEMVGKASYGDYYQAVDNWFSKNNIDSVKEYVKTYGSDIAECGNTKKNGTPQPVPSDGYVKHDTLGSSHPGPFVVV